MSGPDALRIAVMASLVVLTIGYGAKRPDALKEASAAYRDHNLLTAVQRALDHLDRHPGERPAALLAAHCLSQLRFPDQAERYYREARKSGPLGIDELQVRAQGYLQTTHHFEQADDAYQEILRLDPNNVLALQRGATVKMARNRTTEALALAERLASIPAAAATGYALVGSIQHDHGRFEPSARAYARVLELDPDLRSRPPEFFPIFWSELTQDLLASGRTDEARRLLTRALSRHEHPVLKNLLGEVELRDGAVDEADRWWQSATADDPNLSDAWINLGQSALTRGRPEESIKYLDRASELDPGNYRIFYSLSLAYQRLGRSSDAERYRQQAARLRGKGTPSDRGMGAQPSSP